MNNLQKAVLISGTIAWAFFFGLFVCALNIKENLWLASIPLCGMQYKKLILGVQSGTHMGLGQPIVNDAGFLSSLIKMDELQICYYSRNLATGAAFAEQGFIYLIYLHTYLYLITQPIWLHFVSESINQLLFIKC